MRNLDILAAESGEHVRVLLCREEQSYVVSCQHFRMPYPVASDLLAELQPVPAETYSVFVLDEDITNRQREGRNRKLDLIAPLLEDACIYDKSHRNEVVRQIAAEHGIARRTVLQYLWRYWVYQSKNALLPAERPAPEQHELTADEKAIRWALNKYYYTPQRQSLQTAYKMMLRAKYCDTHGTLKPEYPTFWQFRYFFRKNRDPISETISRQGLKAYQRNHRPFTGSVCDYAHGQYSVQSEAAAFQNGYALMHGNALAASIGGGNSFSVIGVSGLGKSTALQRVLSLFPQVIEHTSYHGQNFYCHQIPYLVVQTPHDASIKALILDIYLQIDSLVGTSYQKDALSRRLSIDVLVSQLNQIVRVNHIGLLVIDELQNIAYRKSDGGMRFLNFLVHLINGAGVSICMVGTPRVLQVLQQEFRSARRTTGLVYDRLPNDKEFALLLHGLWHYQYTQYATDLTPELENWLYRKTQGIPDILVKLLYNAQKQAILDGREKLDLEVFESAFLRNLGMVSEYISELSTKSVAKRQTKTAPEVSVGSAAPVKIVGNDIRVLLKKAKKSGELPVSAYAEYIKGEVAI